MERRTHGITQFSVYLGSISEPYDKESEKIKKKNNTKESEEHPYAYAAHILLYQGISW